MQASVNFIIKKQPKAIDLFSLIGLLPGGVSKDSLTKIWGPDWYNYMAHLMEAQLIQMKNKDTEQGTYKLLPFMQPLSTKVSSAEDLKMMHIMICMHFVKVMKSIFLRIGLDSEKDNYDKLKKDLLNNETNLWACLDRIKEYAAKKESFDIQDTYEKTFMEGKSKQRLSSLGQPIERMKREAEGNFELTKSKSHTSLI